MRDHKKQNWPIDNFIFPVAIKLKSSSLSKLLTVYLAPSRFQCGLWGSNSPVLIFLLCVLKFQLSTFDFNYKHPFCSHLPLSFSVVHILGASVFQHFCCLKFPLNVWTNYSAFTTIMKDLYSSSVFICLFLTKFSCILILNFSKTHSLLKCATAYRRHISYRLLKHFSDKFLHLLDINVTNFYLACQDVLVDKYRL